jgi:hypothetical protein
MTTTDTLREWGYVEIAPGDVPENIDWDMPRRWQGQNVALEFGERQHATRTANGTSWARAGVAPYEEGASYARRVDRSVSVGPGERMGVYPGAPGVTYYARRV